MDWAQGSGTPMRDNWQERRLWSRHLVCVATYSFVDHGVHLGIASSLQDASGTIWTVSRLLSALGTIHSVDGYSVRVMVSPQFKLGFH